MCVCGCMCTKYKLISHGLSFPPDTSTEECRRNPPPPKMPEDIQERLRALAQHGSALVALTALR
jgi:hypothetical protein